MPDWRVYHGDCRDILKQLPDNSVDAVVDDAPYGLNQISPQVTVDALTAWLAGKPYTPSGGGFCGKKWDAFVPGPDTWREVVRVLKPGGHLAVMFGSRTQDLGAIAMRLGGLEIRDTTQWLYLNGYAKNHNVSMAVDKHLGVERGKVRVKAREIRNPKSVNGGHGVAGADRPYMQRAQEVGYHDMTSPEPVSPEAQQWYGYGTHLKPGYEPVVIARKPLDGTVAENVLKWGTGVLNIAACRVGYGKGGWGGKNGFTRTHMAAALGGLSAKANGVVVEPDGLQRTADKWPANVLLTHGEDCTDDDCVPDCPVLEYSLQCGSHVAEFLYCQKPSPAERDLGLHTLPDGTLQRMNPGGLANDPKWANRPAKNTHVTCKPVGLTRWLSRLVCPAGGTILDVHLGSGTSGVGAVLEGFNFIGCEIDEEYVDISRRRILYACTYPEDFEAPRVTARRQADPQATFEGVFE